MSRGLRIAIYAGIGLAVLVIGLILAVLIILQTPWFKNNVRDRIVYEIETSTGGKAEIGKFDFSVGTQTATVENLVIRGTEAPGQPPLLRAQSVQLELNVVSISRRQIDLKSLVIARPEVHLIVYRDGRTNLPRPATPGTSPENPVERIIDLAIGQFRVTDGTITVDYRKTPFEADGEDLRAQFDFDKAASAYNGEISFGTLHAKLPNAPPLALQANARITLKRDRIEIANAHLSYKDSSADITGAIVNFTAPRVELSYVAHVDAAELAPYLDLKGLKKGKVTLRGQISNVSAPKTGWAVPLGSGAVVMAAAYQIPPNQLFPGITVESRLQASGVTYSTNGFTITDVTFSADVSGTPEEIVLPNLRLTGRVVRLSNQPPLARIRNFPVRLTASITITPRRVEVNDLNVYALGGRVSGSFELLNDRDFRVAVSASGFSLEELTRLAGLKNTAWNGTVSGPVRITGAIRNGKIGDLKAQARLGIQSAPGPEPVSGLVDVAYDQRAGTIAFGRSFINLRSSRAQFSGTLGQRLDVVVESANLTDFEPVFALASSGRPLQLPVTLRNGTARFEGTVIGPLEHPRIEGQAALTNFVVEGRSFDLFQANLAVSESGARAGDVLLRKQQMQLAGALEVGLHNWSPAPDQPVSGRFTLSAPNVAQLAAEAGQSLPITGDLTAAINLMGTIGAPQATARVTVANGMIDDQPFDRIQANLRYSETLIQASPAVIQIGPSRIELSAAFQHPRNRWNAGTVRFEISTRNVYLGRLKAVQDKSPGLQGRLETQLAGEFSFTPANFRMGFLNGELALRDLAFEKKPMGSVALVAETRGTDVNVNLTGALAGSNIRGASHWVLAGDYPVQGTVEFSKVDFSTVLSRFGVAELPFNAYAAGKVDFSGSTLQPQSWQARVALPEVQITPRLAAVGPAQAAATTLTNNGPVVIQVTSKAARIQQAQFSGKDTSFRASGTFAFASKNPWDIRVQGSVNLALLENFDPSLTSTGNFVIDASLRGPLAKPEVFGRAEIQKGSVYLANVPNGLDNINAVILLFRDRATIERFTAESGGGKVSLTGFLGFGTPLTYYIQAKGNEVRLRSPQGITIAADALLNLTGTSEHSVLAGDVTVTRVAFNPQTDIGSLLGRATQPTPTAAAPGRFTQGLRFDVQIRTSPQVRFETALARGLQAEAELRLRGDLTRPLLLGRILVSQGEILFFGNKYTIDSGEILFVNPTKILPLVNLSLQTRVRGIDVTLSVTGPVNKLNVTYRSDPPLQFSEIISLLATGQAPPTAPGLVGAQTAQSQSWEQAGASALLSQALANPLAGRLQRFFGVTSLKIAPSISGTTNAPEARVTLEQQITPDITLTYITNLAHAAEQTIQVEWDLTKSWSGIATREATGLFGIDFLYRRTFK